MAFLSRRAVVAATRSLSTARCLLSEAPKVNPELRKRKLAVSAKPIISGLDCLMSPNTEIIEQPDSVTQEAGIEGRIPENFEQATGLERQEMIEIAKGNDV